MVTQELILSDGNLVCALINGEPCSLAVIKKLAHSYNGRDVYELASAVTLPQFAHRGLYSQMRNQLVELIRSKHPNAVILVANSNSAFLDKNPDWKRIGLEKDIELRIGEVPDGFMDNPNVRQLIEDGWDSYVLE